MQLPLQLGNDQINFIRDIRKTIQESAYQHIRIIGEPGIGKTRLIFESISQDEIAPSIIYVPTGEDFQKSRLFNELLKPDKSYSVTLIIDDCDNRDRTSIWSALKGRSGLKLITIDHGPEHTHDAAMKTFICPQLQEEEIIKILSEYLPNRSDLSNWAGWCDGSPRVAHAVGENLKNNPENILKSPADVPIWDRYIIGHKTIESYDAEQHRIVMRHIALFQKFGFESPVHEEGQFICSLVQKTDSTITWGKFQTIVQYYRQKRILQGRHTLFIVPKALHIHLWLEFWEQHGRGIDFQNLMKQLPSTLKRWFMQLFIYAHNAQPAQQFVKDILSQIGPFSDPKFLKSEAGLRFINYLSEADPSSTLSLLERTIKTWPEEKLLKWNSGRQDIVWALEKIVVWDNLFIRATNVLLPMALAENANNSNNSKGLLLSLFKVGLGWSPTQASPTKRFPILQRLIKSDDNSKRTLGFELCEQWLSTHGGIRMVGAEHQGLRPTIEFWRPKTYGELFNFWRDVLNLIRTELRGYGSIVRNQAANVIINSASGLIQFKNMAEEVLELLFELAQDSEISKKSLTRFVISMQCHRGEGLSEEILLKINELDKIITGNSFWEKVNRYVLNTNWDEDYTFRGEECIELKTPVKRVQKLALELMDDFNLFSEHLRKLLRSDGHRLTQFGFECGKLSTPEFNDYLFSQFEDRTDGINGNFISGYFAGLRSHDEETWKTQISLLLQQEDTRKVAIDCIWQSGFTESIIRQMILLLKKNAISPNAFDRFRFRRQNNEINENLFQEILTELLNHPDSSAGGICTHLAQGYYFNKDASGDFPEELIFSVISAIPSTQETNQMNGYYWKIVASKFLNKHPERSLELLNHILSNMERISRYDNSTYIAKIADEIVIANPHKSWAIISKHLLSDSKNRFGTINWLENSGFEETPTRGAINFIPPEQIIDWVKENTKERIWIVEPILPKTLDRNEGQLTIQFIEEFCDDENMSDSLFWHFWTGGWSGPESRYLERKRDAARQWLAQSPSDKIQIWIEKYIDHLNNRIEKTQIDEERRF